MKKLLTGLLGLSLVLGTVSLSLAGQQDPAAGQDQGATQGKKGRKGKGNRKGKGKRAGKKANRSKRSPSGGTTAPATPATPQP